MSASLTPQEMLTVAMTGSFEAPPDASGNAEPEFETFVLDAVSLIKADGTKIAEFASGPGTFRIIDRPQIVVQNSLSSQVGTAFSGIELQFEGAVVGGGKYSSTVAVTLADAAPQYVGAFTVEKAKGIRLDVLVGWKNTVTRDDAAKTETISSPAFTLDLSNE